MFVRKKCPPYCSNYCQEQHHKLIVSLLNVQENDRKSLEKFKKRVSFYYDSLQPKDPIPDPVKEYRYPLMHWAGVLGKISAVEHLIERGHPTDIQSAGKSEGTMHRVVHCLAGTMKNYKLEQIIKRFKGLTDILSDALFIADDNGNTPLHSCAVYITELDNEPLLSFYKRALEIMIDKVIDIGDRDSALTDILNIQNKEGNTILHILSCKQEGCPEIATQLLKEGVNLNLRNSDGKTAFEIASESSRKMAKVIHLYQRRKAKLEQQVEPSVSSSAADMSSPASSCGHHKKPASNEHSLVSSTSKEDLNTLHERSVSKEDDVIFMSSDPGQGGKRRKIAPKKEDIKPTLIKTSEEYTPHLSTTHMDTTTTSDCNTVFDGTEPRGRTQSRENNPSSSPRMEFGVLSIEESDDMIKPNLVKLLKSVGQEKPVLEVVQRSKKDLEENLKEGENKLTGFIEKREQCHADKEKITEELNAKRNELEVLMNNLRARKEEIIILDKQMKEEKDLQTNFINELAIHNEILKCLSND